MTASFKPDSTKISNKKNQNLRTNKSAHWAEEPRPLKRPRNAKCNFDLAVCCMERLSDLDIRNFRLESGRSQAITSSYVLTPHEYASRLAARCEAEADEPLKAIENVLEQIAEGNRVNDMLFLISIRLRNWGVDTSCWKPSSLLTGIAGAFFSRGPDQA